MKKMSITFSDIDHDKVLTRRHEFNKMDGSGENIPPSLIFSDIPGGTKSLAVTLYDPDAPTGSGFWHWTVYDLPSDCTMLNEGIPISKDGKTLSSLTAINDFGESGYGGPCPPKGTAPHRYIVTLHSLSVESLGVNPNETTNAIIRYLINLHTLDTTSVTAYYGRN